MRAYQSDTIRLVANIFPCSVLFLFPILRGKLKSEGSKDKVALSTPPFDLWRFVLAAFLFSLLSFFLRKSFQQPVLTEARSSIDAGYLRQSFILCSLFAACLRSAVRAIRKVPLQSCVLERDFQGWLSLVR